jgi:hypothetical protein
VAEPLPTQQELQELLEYDPATGVLRWKVRDVKWFTDGAHSALHQCRKWNAAHAGKKALPANRNGYKCGYILDRRVYAHRVIWKFVHNIRKASL